ncbi:MAG: TlpA disulfide reductase family protein [Candidatus Kapabacteria bacterium]|nr:TlpA disulfide reductase family protein [Candidatus Kapabacteria bacterium]
MTTSRAICALLILLSVRVCHAQVKEGIAFDRVDSVARTYLVTYLPPSSSVYATPTFTDTLFCAAIISTLRGTKTNVTPMTRISDARYTSVLTLPDSSYSVRIEACIPTDRAPEGMAIFDVELDHERSAEWSRLYYNHYRRWETINPPDIDDLSVPPSPLSKRRLDSVTAIVKAGKEQTFDRYLTLALMYGNTGRGDSLESVYLDSACAAQLRIGGNEPLLEDGLLWNGFFYPMMRNGVLDRRTNRIIVMQELAVRYPHTEFGLHWIKSSNGFDRIDHNNMNAIVSSWSNSYDVDVLMAIGNRLLDSTSWMFDPVLAERLLTRAERSCMQQIGFRTGENIFSSMGRVDAVRALLVRALSRQGKHASALELGKRSMLEAGDVFGRQIISTALMSAAKASGDTALITELRNYQLPTLSDFTFETISGRKNSLFGLRGKIVVLDFWFLGCAGCALEHASLNEFGKMYRGDERIEFIAIALNDKLTLEKYLTRFPLAAEIVADGESIAQGVGVTAYPTHIVIDPRGKTLLWEVGGSGAAGEHLATSVTRLLR